MRRPAPAVLVLAAAAALVVAGCAAGTTATPTAAPATDEQADPTPRGPGSLPPPDPAGSPTVAPSGDAPPAGTFRFPAADVVAAYAGSGFACDAPRPSGEAAGYTYTECTAELDGLLQYLGIAAEDATGAIGDAKYGVLGADGVTLPSVTASAEPFGFFLGALLGETAGTEAFTWLFPQIGTEEAWGEVNGLSIVTYRIQDGSSAGFFVELANTAFVEAPAP